MFGLCSFIELYVGYIYFSANVLYLSKIKKKKKKVQSYILEGKANVILRDITIIANISGYYMPALL